MDAVTRGDQFIGWGYIVPAVAIFGIVVFAIAAVVDARRNRRAHARMDRVFVRTLRSVRQDPPRHRARWQFPNPLELLAAHGARREPAGYGPPPPLLPGQGAPRADWAQVDRKATPAPLLNPAVGAARVPRRDRWEELDVISDVLGGRMRAAADFEDTGLIEPIRAEVVR